MATAATRTADPTVAFGLKRMMRNAASYMSPMPSGRSGRAPGLWAAPSMPGTGPGGGGAQPGGGGAHPAAGHPGGARRAAATPGRTARGPGGGYPSLPDISSPSEQVSERAILSEHASTGRVSGVLTVF